MIAECKICGHKLSCADTTYTAYQKLFPSAKCICFGEYADHLKPSQISYTRLYATERATWSHEPHKMDITFGDFVK